MKFETLEQRDTPAYLNLAGGVLTVIGDADSTNVVTIDPAADGVRVTVNGEPRVYVGLTGVVAVGGDKADDFSNNTGVDLTAFGGAGEDRFIGGTGRNLLDGGSGKDVLYALLGDTTLNSDDGRADRVYISASGTANVDDRDQLVTFFADGRVPGSGRVELVGGVLYLTPTNGGSSVTITEGAGRVCVSYDFGAGLQTVSFAKREVAAIAYFGGAGNDFYQNDTRIEEAAYGSAGNDVLVSGFGAFNLLKGSGGADVLVSRGKSADLSGNGGADLLLPLGGPATLRTDALDTLVGVDDADRIIRS